jgi:hypothetical protein
MNKKLDDYKEPPLEVGDTGEDRIVNALETETRNQRRDLDDIDPEAIVAKGDEEVPVGTNTASADALKSLYKKGRQNRELTNRVDADGAPDVERLQQLYAWAGQEMPEGIAPKNFDTNKPDRFNEDRGGESAEQYAERLEQEEQERLQQIDNTGAEIPVTKVLPEIQNDAMVEVVVLGRTLTVPQQDIDDAGGKSAYQKNRAATIRLQRAATLESKAQQKLKLNEEQQYGVQLDDPSTDGQSDVDIDSLHEEMMDVVVDGTVDEMKAWMKEKLKPKAPPVKPQASTPTRSPEEARIKESEIQEELRQQFEADRVEANEMMQTEYVDIMRDPDLLGLAQQRFNVIKTNPNNEGRSQKEMAREAAQFVRTIGKRLSGDYIKPDPIEKDRQERIERKRQLPQQSRADRQAPSAAPQTRQVPTRKEHFLRLRQRAGHDLPLKE